MLPFYGILEVVIVFDGLVGTGLFKVFLSCHVLLSFSCFSWTIWSIKDYGLFNQNYINDFSDSRHSDKVLMVSERKKNGKFGRFYRSIQVMGCRGIFLPGCCLLFKHCIWNGVFWIGQMPWISLWLNSAKLRLLYLKTLSKLLKDMVKCGICIYYKLWKKNTKIHHYISLLSDWSFEDIKKPFSLVYGVGWCNLFISHTIYLAHSSLVFQNLGSEELFLFQSLCSYTRNLCRKDSPLWHFTSHNITGTLAYYNDLGITGVLLLKFLSQFEYSMPDK